jgi:hypothetical protein
MDHELAPLQLKSVERGCGRKKKAVGLIANRSFESIGGEWYKEQVPFFNISYNNLLWVVVLLGVVFGLSYGGCQAGRQCGDCVPTP